MLFHKTLPTVGCIIKSERFAHGDILYAYSNTELRGLSNPNQFPLSGEMIFTLMVYGHGIENESLDFVLYDIESDKYFNLDQKINFEPNMIIGDAIDPIVLNGESNEMVSSLEIVSAYPNPFNPVTNIDYYMSESNNITISVFDIMGRQVELLDNGFKDSGYHSIVWDASHQASGVYYIQIVSNAEVQTQKVMLLK